MAAILHLDTSPRGDRSISRSLTKEFMTGWLATHPTDTTTYRDIGHYPPPYVSETWIAGAFTPPEQHTPEIAEAIRLSDQFIDEFVAADRYVIGVPMHNFAIPANFKAYIDQILRVGRTFVVENGGYKGLLTNKKMLIITARGGTYPKDTPYAAYDMQEPYIRLAFGFIGISDITFIHTENLAMGNEVRIQAIANSQTAIQDAIAAW
jgi:FMN-dependent NADH-azoreductase